MKGGRDGRGFVEQRRGHHGREGSGHHRHIARPRRGSLLAQDGSGKSDLSDQATANDENYLSLPDPEILSLPFSDRAHGISPTRSRAEWVCELRVDGVSVTSSDRTKQ